MIIYKRVRTTSIALISRKILNDFLYIANNSYRNQNTDKLYQTFVYAKIGPPTNVSNSMSMDKLLTTIKDGKWHNIDQLAAQFGLAPEKLIKLSELLSQRQFLTYEDERRRIRLEPLWKLLLPEEEEPPDSERAVATLIIPPESSITVQSTHISNLSNIELEVNLRINRKKIEEIAIKT